MDFSDGIAYDKCLRRGGQLSATVDAMSFRTTFQYDGAGNRTSVEDANGKLTTTVYFSNRNQAQATVDAMRFSTTYAHDLQGRLLSTQGANGHFVTNVYDRMRRLQFVENVLGENARQYGYDLAVCEATLGELNS